ncbi:NUDIX hydrolase [Bacillus chungangensis]|uniref:8-oxo-dGTP pyrophosphatase MutT (NUDIX family) n=1 Tax=Bacillus chungangensis TaxID=587633 RepID=A0ABT9WX97_9BACI|nr:NUDIX domain-containing protein [Bacillus chungangensis]MDQ0177738.1 8-oxo-dGTP pyrophosphatase MutT (NUDIX family) [Bacillus chungangensis]
MEVSLYYVFPGGGLENGETPEEGAKREALEELGVEVNIKECIAEVAFNGTQYYFLADIVSGVFGTGQGEEFTNLYRNRETYLPIWIEIGELSSIDVIPKEVAKKVESFIK